MSRKTQKSARSQMADLILSGHHGRYRPYEVFYTFLVGMLKHFGLPMKDDNEKRMADADLIALASQIAEQYCDAVSHTEPFDDILGSLYEEIASNGHKSSMGQFFTPQTIADMIAVFTIGDDDTTKLSEHQRSNGVLLSMLDPACGSGVMLLSAMRHITRAGRHQIGDWCFTAVDLDRTCALMVAVQLLTNSAVHGITPGELIVVNGDSLAPWRCWKPLLHATALGVRATRDPYDPGFAAGVIGQAKMHPCFADQLSIDFQSNVEPQPA